MVKSAANAVTGLAQLSGTLNTIESSPDLKYMIMMNADNYNNC